MRLASTGCIVLVLGALGCSSSGDSSGANGSNGGDTGANGGDTSGAFDGQQGLGADGGTAAGNGGLGGGAMLGNAALEDGGTPGEKDLEALRNAACAGEAAATEPLPSVLQLVVDVSGSMSRDAPGSPRSKWEVTRDALSDAIASLPDATAVGVLYYPNMDTTRSIPTGTGMDSPRPPEACVNAGGLIPVDELGPQEAPHRTTVLDSLNTVNGPQGGTPTHDAYRLAFDALSAASATAFPGDRFILLITDGQPTFLSGCRGTGNIRDAVDPRPIIDEAEQAAAGDVSTFVIGSPGSEEVGLPVFDDARTWLSRTASVGGTASPGCSDDGPDFCHFDMTQEPDFSAALRDALQSIVGQVLSCTYKLPNPPSGQQLDPGKVNMIFTPKGADSELIPQAPDGQCSEGWRYSDDGSRIELCEATCDRVQSANDPEIELLFGCSTETGPVR